MFDRVLIREIEQAERQVKEGSQCPFLPHHIAAICLYIQSKFIDPKYLVSTIFLKGVEMTEIKFGMRAVLADYQE